MELDKQQINRLAATYRETRTSEDFKMLYDAVIAWKRRWTSDVSKLLDPHDMEHVYNYTLYRAACDYKQEVGDFENLFNWMVKRRKTSLLRSELRRVGRTAPRKRGDDSAHGSQILNLSSTEQSPEQSLMEKEQLQLLSSMAACADDLTQKILRNYSLYDSQNALSKALGIHHEVVKRKLRALSSKLEK